MGIGFVPGVGQIYGAASSAAALRDPDASALEKGMAGLSMLPMGNLMSKAGKLRKVVIGERIAKGTAHEDDLRRAKELYEGEDVIDRTAGATVPSKGPKGVTRFLEGDPRINDYIQRETGWWKDPETGRWMKELHDTGSHVDMQKLRDLPPDAAKFPARPQNFTTLDKILSHPELDKLPVARKLRQETEFIKPPDYRPGRGHHRGEFTYVDSGGKMQDYPHQIAVGDPQVPTLENFSKTRDAALHEQQHGIDFHEDFSAGGMPKGKTWEDYKDYLKIPGEVHARISALRRNMTPEARRKFPFHKHIREENMRITKMDPKNGAADIRYATMDDLRDLMKKYGMADPDEFLNPGP